MKTHEMGVAVPASPELKISETCSVSLVGKVPAASFCRGTGGYGWVL